MLEVLLSQLASQVVIPKISVDHRASSGHCIVHDGTATKLRSKNWKVPRGALWKDVERLIGKQAVPSTTHAGMDKHDERAGSGLQKVCFDRCRFAHPRLAAGSVRRTKKLRRAPGPP